MKLGSEYTTDIIWLGLQSTQKEHKLDRKKIQKHAYNCKGPNFITKKLSRTMKAFKDTKITTFYLSKALLHILKR